MKDLLAWIYHKGDSLSNLGSIRGTLIERDQKIWPTEKCLVIN